MKENIEMVDVLSVVRCMNEQDQNHGQKTMNSHKTAAAHKPLDLCPGQSIELLKELHMLTREGKLNPDSRRKLKQDIYLFQFIDKLLKELPATDRGPTLADHGAGKP